GWGQRRHSSFGYRITDDSVAHAPAACSPLAGGRLNRSRKTAMETAFASRWKSEVGSGFLLFCKTRPLLIGINPRWHRVCAPRFRHYRFDLISQPALAGVAVAALVTKQLMRCVW